MTILANSYFSGAGLLDEGLRRAGITVQQSFEIDKVCCATLRKNSSGGEVVEGDLRQKLVKTDKAAHVKFFTYPCKSYSPIAAIHGRLTGDELYLHALRHTVIEPPEVYGLENVPGLRAFPLVMEAMTQLPGYFVQTFCPVESSLWLPQRRARLIVLASRRAFAWRPPESHRRVSLREIIETEPRVEIPDYVAKRIRGEYRDKPIVSDPAKDDLAPTCVANYAKDLSTRLVKDARYEHGVRPYSVREYARLQGVPDDFTFCGTDRDAYRMIGNGVSVPVGEWIGRELRRYFS